MAKKPAKKNKAPANKPKTTAPKRTATSDYKPMNPNAKGKKYSSLPQSKRPKGTPKKKKTKLPKSAQFIQDANW